MLRAILKGAIVGGIAGALLLTGMHLWFNSATRTKGTVVSALVLYLMLAGPGAAIAGGLVGRMSYRWQQRGTSRGWLSFYAALLGAAMGNGVAFASLGFLYSFGAIANRLTISEWVGAFLPLFLAFIPRASVLGLLCGFLVAWAVWETKTSRIRSANHEP